MSIIIVNYKSANQLLTCLSDLAKLPHAEKLDIIVINNDPIKLQIPSFPLTIRIIEINENMGFGRANNHGLLLSSRQYICFLNPDTHSFSTNFLDILNHITDQNIAVSPLILNEDSTPQQWSCGDRVSLLSILRSNVGYINKSWLSQSLTHVHWISGTAFFTTRDLLKKLSGFDEDFFLYFEDVDLCERIIKNNGNVLLIPHISVKHASGSSSKNARKFQKRCYYRSQDIFIKKHYSAFHVLILRVLRVFHRS